MKSNFELPAIPKENAFNAIRLLLCLIVLFMHAFGKVGIGNAYLFDGHMAVCGFFIISGFWVTKSYFAAPNLKAFFTKRAKKIFPMYYISLIFFSLVCCYFSELPAREYFCEEYFKYLFWNAIFLNFMHPSLPGCFAGNAVNGALRTIKIEIGFYLILPLILHFWKKMQTALGKNMLFAILYALSVAYNLILKLYAKNWHLPSQLEHQLPGFISFFVSGIFIFLNWDFFLKMKNKLLLPSVAAYILHYVTKSEILFPAALAVIIVWTALTFKRLQCVGQTIDFSWGIYLFHFPLMQILYHCTGGIVCPPVYVASILGISFTFAFIAEKYVQKRIK